MDHIVWQLKGELRELDRLIREELSRPDPDHLLVRDLQRQKVQIKDELILARAGLRPVYI